MITADLTLSVQDCRVFNDRIIQSIVILFKTKVQQKIIAWETLQDTKHHYKVILPSC